MNPLASFIRSARRSKGITQEVAAEQAGMSQPELSRIENGRQEPTIRKLSRLADVLDFDAAAAMECVSDLLREAS